MLTPENCDHGKVMLLVNVLNIGPKMLLLVPLEHKIPNDRTCVGRCYPSKLNTTACPPDFISICFVILPFFLNIFSALDYRHLAQPQGLVA